MRLAALDLETTGLDLQSDRILKLGLVLLEVGCKTPIFEREWTLWHDSYPDIKKDAYEAHGIEKRHCIECGETPIGFYPKLAILLEPYGIDYLVAHNGHRFDFPMLASNIMAFDNYAAGYFTKLKKIDTAIDCPYPDSIKTRKLIHLAAEHGFINPFPHSALSDIRTMLKIMQSYDLADIIARSESPNITIHAHTEYEQRELARARGFFWDAPSKRWLKKVKQMDLSKELDGAEFNITLI